MEINLYHEADESTVHLPICVPAPIKCYLPVSIISNIITANTKSYDWIMTNYIQLYRKCSSDRIESFPVQDFMYVDQGILSCTELNEFVHPLKRISFIQDLIYWIDHNNYVVVYLNEQMLKEVRSVDKPYIHSELIFGYNLNTRTFRLLNFREDTKDIGVIEVPFEEFEEAFYCESTRNLYKNTELPLIKKKGYKILLLRMLQGRGRNYDEHLDIESIHAQLYQYVKGINSSSFTAYFTRKLMGGWGMGVYKELIGIVESSRERPEKKLDYRNFHVIYEHKHYMKLRLALLDEIGEKTQFAETYTPIEEEAVSLKNLCIKYNLSRNAKLLTRIQESLKHMEALEGQVLSDYLKCKASQKW